MRYQLVRLASAAAVLLNLAACARNGPVGSGPVKPAPRSLDQLSVQERQDILRRAQVWRPIDTATLDLKTGPAARGAFAPDQQVTCTFVYPDEPSSGLTPKFRCDLGGDDVVKVKYGRTNGEVYGVVAASRLLWALGFAVPTWYPVRVTCLKCPQEPWATSSRDWFKGRPQFVWTRTFDVAAIERDFPGQEIKTSGFEGWAWPELDAVDEEAGGASRAQIDALKLAAVFLQHNDTKPVQQRLICPDGQQRKDASSNETCGAAQLVLGDVGATFGEGSFWAVSKVELEKWRRSPVWKDASGCVGHLDRYLNGTLEHPAIGEAGRRLLADKLSQLSDAQLRDLFTVARMDVRGQGTIDDWVQAFKERRAQIVNRRCPSA